MSSSSSASSSNTTDPKWMHDFFISFTEEDVAVERFIVTLNAQLGMIGIRACFDHIDMVRNKQETSLLSQLQAIEGSRVSIVVFSEHYGGNSWHLRELGKIMECHREKGQVVFPVFYGVDMWEVRKQRGKFGQVFEQMIKRSLVKEDTALSWRRALADAAFFPGCFVSPEQLR
ncbi:Toll/interleukin-1 receptor-like proteiny [Sesbania bispinosa]|nr:Toll/interleukin-1 receptor-like proteiny [Sesbania bispinosa]